MSSDTVPLGQRLTAVAYSNVGFALFRLLLPKLAGLVQDDISAQEKWKHKDWEEVLARSYATAYEKIITENIFKRVGVEGPSTHTPVVPPFDYNHAFYYYYPGVSEGWDWRDFKYPGQDWPGDGQPLCAGAGCWWLSIDDFTPVLDSINNTYTTSDFRILTEIQWVTMGSPIWLPTGYTKNGLGLDTIEGPGTNTYDYDWVEKNGGVSGGDKWGKGTGSASVAFFAMDLGYPPMYAALFINSDISGGPGSDNSWFACTQCLTLFSPANGGTCSATGKAHVAWGQYILFSGKQVGSQGGWRRCSKCGALCLELSPTDPSVCPTDGKRHACAGESFVLSETVTNTFEVQPGWTQCKNCGVIAYSNGSSTSGVCAALVRAGGKPADSPHQFASDSTSYGIQEVVGADTVLAEAFLASFV